MVILLKVLAEPSLKVVLTMMQQWMMVMMSLLESAATVDRS